MAGSRNVNAGGKCAGCDKSAGSQKIGEYCKAHEQLCSTHKLAYQKGGQCAACLKAHKLAEKNNKK